MTFHEYPKALYADSQANGYAVAKDASEEEALRGQGLRMLQEWYDLERGAAAPAFVSARSLVQGAVAGGLAAKLDAEIMGSTPPVRRGPGRPKKADAAQAEA